MGGCPKDSPKMCDRKHRGSMTLRRRLAGQDDVKKNIRKCQNTVKLGERRKTVPSYSDGFIRTMALLR